MTLSGLWNLPLSIFVFLAHTPISAPKTNAATVKRYFVYKIHTTNENCVSVQRALTFFFIFLLKLTIESVRCVKHNIGCLLFDLGIDVILIYQWLTHTVRGAFFYWAAENKFVEYNHQAIKRVEFRSMLRYSHGYNGMSRR